MHDYKKDLVPIFIAVAAISACTVITIYVISFGGPGKEAGLWLAVAASLVALLSILWMSTRTRRGMAIAEQAAAALREKEIALRETEERFSAVCDNARAAFGILVGTRLVYANRYFSELTGYSVEDLLSIDFRQMTHPSYHQLMLDRARKRLAGEPVPNHYEFLALTKTGEERWIDFSAAPTELHGKPVIIGTGFDITERKKGEAALKESEEKFRLLAENSRVFICILRDRRVLYANPYLVAVSGYTQEELLSLDTAVLIPPEDRELVLDRAHRRQEGEVLATSYEYRLLAKSGEIHWVEFWAVRIDYRGSAAILAAGIDITQRKRAENALRESQERFRIVAENARGVFGIVQGKRFIYANPFLAEISGYSVEEILSMDFVELLHPDYREQVADYARRRQLGEEAPTHYEVAMLTKDGQTRWVELSVGRTEYNGRPAIVGTAYDVTARRQAEEQLRRSEEQFRRLAESLPQLVWIAGPDGKLEYVNERWCEYTGTPCVDAIRGAWAGLLHSEDFELATSRWRHSVQTGEPYEVEFRLKAKDGAYLWFLARALPIHNDEGRISRWFGTCTDIHESKEAQAGLEQFARELAQAKTTAEKAQVTAEQANKAKDQFLAVLSHELRTPLTPVLAAVSMLQKKPEINDRVNNDLEMIRRNVEMEARLIDDLLDLTRIARGKIELDRRPVELCTVIQRAVDVCRPDIEARRLHFTVDFGAQPYIVEADIARLQQVFWNLLRNSIKFTPHGGCVAVRCVPDNGEVVVQVNDSGIGIASDSLASIFDAFAQGDRGITRQFGGLGLGLAICKSLVELHHGTIEAHSDGEGKGATFAVRLPLLAKSGEKGASAAPDPSAQSRTTRARSLRLLVVEDHGDTSEMLRVMLEAEGHHVETACDVAMALNTMSQRSFDMLISDLGLPDGSGLDLIRELRARGHHVPSIALSGYGQEQDVQQSREAGFSYHITKPVDFDRLVEAVSKAVTERAL